MFTTHTLGQTADLNNITNSQQTAKTDLLTLHAGSLLKQVAFNHRLFGLMAVSSAKTISAKWYDSCTYYESFRPDVTLTPSLNPQELFNQIIQVKKADYDVKAAILGPISLMKTLSFESEALGLQYLTRLLPLYSQLLVRLGQLKLPWVQFDEPMLTQSLDKHIRHAYRSSYFGLQRAPVKIMVSAGFGSLKQNLQLACQLPVQALHVDCLEPNQMMRVVDWLPRHKILSLGVINGQDLAKSDLMGLLTHLKPIAERLKKRLWLAPNVSFVHLSVEESTSNALHNPFVLQKIRELNSLAQALKDGEFTQPIRLFRSNPIENNFEKDPNSKVA